MDIANHQPLDALETTERGLHRAQTESFAFRLANGDVFVTNLTYQEPAEHEFRVSVTDGVPVSCTCPADSHYAPACKHRLAVAIRDAVLDAIDRMQVAADGGAVPEETPADQKEDIEVSEDDCDCAELPDGVPCWLCYRDGRVAFED